MVGSKENLKTKKLHRHKFFTEFSKCFSDKALFCGFHEFKTDCLLCTIF